MKQDLISIQHCHLYHIHNYVVGYFELAQSQSSSLVLKNALVCVKWHN